MDGIYCNIDNINGYEKQRILIEESVYIVLPEEAVYAEEVDTECMLGLYTDSIETGIHDLIVNARIVE